MSDDDVKDGEGKGGGDDEGASLLEGLEDREELRAMAMYGLAPMPAPRLSDWDR